MRLLNIFLVFLLIMTGCDTASKIEPRFQHYFIKYYGDEGNQEGVDVKEIEDGFIVLGNSSTVPGNSQILLTKVNKLGNEVWSKYFGGPWENKAAAVDVDGMGNYIIAATVQNTQGDNDVMILKVGPDGLKIDSAVFGSTGENDVANDILVTREGDYILTGYTTNVDTRKPGYSATTDLEDIYSIRTTSELVQFNEADWRRVYGFPGLDRGIELIQKDDGTFLFFGTTDKPPTSNSQQDGTNMFLFPAGQDGIALSSAPLQLFGTLSNESAAQIVASEGGFAMFGTSKEPGSSKPYLARVRSNNAYISSGVVAISGEIEGISMAAAFNGGLIMLGRKIENTNSNIHIVRLAADGSIRWEQSFGGIDRDAPGSILELEDGSIIFVGTITLESQSKICLIKVTERGELKP